MIEVIFFGAGQYAKMLNVLLDGMVDVKYYIDNDHNKWGYELNGITIHSPDELLKEKGDFIVVIAAEGVFEEIRNQLIQCRAARLEQIYSYSSFCEYLCAITKNTVPSKMNFSRGLFFSELCKSLMSDFDSEVVLRKISNVIETIVEKADAGFWRVAGGDLTFIKYMKLLQGVIEKNKKNRKSPTLYSLVNELSKQAIVETEDKLKVAFLADRVFCWSSLESVYSACANDDRFTAQIVYVPFYHINTNSSVNHYEIYKDKMNLPVFRHTEYNISAENPDVVFYVNPYDLSIPFNYSNEHVGKVVSRIVYMGYALEIASWAFDYYFQCPIQQKAWKHIVYGEKIKDIAVKKNSKNGGNNIVAWGHPRADHYMSIEVNREKISDVWKNKIKNRKTFLWNTHHTIIEKDVGGGTFFRWKDEVLDYFNNNDNAFLLWRPHPLMFGVLINNGLMTEAELNNLVELIQNKENALIDLSSDYRNSFYASDAIITDGTGFLVEYLYTGKPIIYTPRGIDNIFFYEEFCENVYTAKNSGDITEMINQLSQGVDTLREKRHAFADELLTVHSGGNGEYIKEQIYEEILNEEKQRGI